MSIGSGNKELQASRHCGGNASNGAHGEWLLLHPAISLMTLEAFARLQM